MFAESKKDEEARWANAEKSWKTTRAEVRKRVNDLRKKLEKYRALWDASIFDLASVQQCGGPRSFLAGVDIDDPIELAEQLNPSIAARFEMIEEYCRARGTHLDFDFNAQLFQLKSLPADTGFKIGILAGVVFSGAPKKLIDRFARALAMDLQCDAKEEL